MPFYKPLQKAILWQLAQKHMLTTKELYENIQVSYTISLKNFYKIINQLIDVQILSKTKKHLSLNARWVQELEQFIEIAKDTTIHTHSQYLLTPGESKVYKTWSIMQTDNIWWDMLIAIQNHYQWTQDAYIYYSHAHYMVWAYESEVRYWSHQLNRDHQRKSQTIFLIWNNTFLDRIGMQKYKDIGAQIFHDEEHLFHREWYYFNVIWEYIIEFIHPKECVDFFQIFFDSIQDISKLNLELFKSIFQKCIQCTIRITRNAHKAKEIAQSIQHLWNKHQSREKMSHL